jgi:hypothetical protein
MMRKAVAAIVLAFLVGRVESRQAGKAGAAPAGACDFNASFMTWDYPNKPDSRGSKSRHRTPLGNKARIEIEALIDVVNEASGASERFVLVAPCRTEWVYADDNLFQLPSNEYRVIFSLTEERSMGSSITAGSEPIRVHRVADEYTSLKIDVKTFPRSRLLRTPADVNTAVAANLPVVGRTTIRDPQRKERYVIEYPVRTMNFRPENGSFQVDTGPLLVPDPKATATRTIERLEMAHIAYNHVRLDRAEFILRRPTPIKDASGREVARVLHFSEVHALPATTQLFAGEK